MTHTGAMSRSMEENGDSIMYIGSDSDSAEMKDGSSSATPWTKEEDENLKILIVSFGKKDWKTIASFLPGRTEAQCIQRWRRYLDPDLVKTSWSKEEDEKMVELVGKYGTMHWHLVARHLKGRIGKQCHDRWVNHLEPQVKKNIWTDEEDVIIYKAHSILGSRWAEIARLLPGRSENSVENHWTCSVRRKAELGLYREQADSISIDIQHYVEGEDDFKCDVVLETDPVIPKVPEKEEEENKPQNLKRKPAAPLPQTSTSKRGRSSPGPLLLTKSRSTPSPSSSSPAARIAAPAVDQKKFVDAALRMIAEDMLPLSFVEGAGFRSFMSIINPEYSRVSQRTLGLQLYDDVERTIRPQFIRELKSCLASTKDAERAVHATVDLWAGAQDPVLVVQLHFISESWQLRRPTVALRHLGSEDLSAAVALELEAVLLSYGIFPHSIGYVLPHLAKRSLAENSLFCDYRAMFSPSRGEPDGDDLVAFVSDQASDTDSLFSKLQIGHKTSCAAYKLQLVIKEALKNSRVVENLLLQVHNVVAFFRRSAYWSEVLMKQSGVSLALPSGNCRWNTTLLCVQRLVQESMWSSVMTLLAQARIESTDMASAPPLLVAKREQVTDILGLLEPFAEALQVLQGNGVTISLIIPSLVGLHKTLESLVTSYSHFSKALRTGLHTHFQELINQREVILSSVLDPRIKLQPFAEVEPEEQTGFLVPKSKYQARALLESTLRGMEAAASLSVEQKAEPQIKKMEQSRPQVQTEGFGSSSDDNNCDGGGGNELKRKTIFSFLQQPAKSLTLSEVDSYLSEPLSETNSCLLFWKSASRFPHLQQMARKLMAVPTSSGGFDRLCPMAACIVKARRNRLPAHTTERLLLYRNSLKTKTGKKPCGSSKHSGGQEVN